MIILYLYENTIQVKEKDIIKEFVLSPEAMMYGKVRNSNLFEQQLHKIVVQEKWITFFKTKKILLIVPANYEAIDKEIFTVILNNLGITKSENEYIVNYETGEVINFTTKVTESGKPLYIYAKEVN